MISKYPYDYLNPELFVFHCLKNEIRKKENETDFITQKPRMEKGS